MRRYIITGAPGAGKTTIVTALRERGYPVVDEAATDVIAREQAAGPRRAVDARPGFVDAILACRAGASSCPCHRGVGRRCSTGRRSAHWRWPGTPASR